MYSDMGIDMSPIDWGGPTRQTCPACGRGPKDRTCGVTVHERGGVARCFRCNYVETLRGKQTVQRLGGPMVRPAAPARHQTLSEFGRELWQASRPLAGEARAYLLARRCVLPPADGDLRWHPALKHPPSGLIGPALVALVTDAVTRTPLSLHRTWVQADGSKAPVDAPRMLLGGHRKASAVVRLWPDEAVTHGLGVAEGIETALSLAHGFRPAWACIDAGNLAALPILDGIEALTIAADNDEAGIAAAEVCAERWHAAGRNVRVVLPPRRGADLNDAARAA
jgi:putative DNA primase/helicase